MTVEWDPNWDRNELPAPRSPACGTCKHHAVEHWPECRAVGCDCAAYVADPLDT